MAGFYFYHIISYWHAVDRNKIAGAEDSMTGVSELGIQVAN